MRELRELYLIVAVTMACFRRHAALGSPFMCFVCSRSAGLQAQQLMFRPQTGLSCAHSMPSRPMMTPPSLFQMSQVSSKAMPLYSLLPAFTEYTAEVVSSRASSWFNSFVAGVRCIP